MSATDTDSTPNGEALREALRRHVEVLTVDIGARAPHLGDNLARAQDYIHAALVQAGLEVAQQAYDYEGRQVANLIARRPDEAADAYYLVGAHYDTVPTTPGADDNASAVAVLLELARRLPSIALPAPVRLVAFTMEEPPAFTSGKQGSRIFVRRRLEAGDRIAGAVVLEMVGYTAPRQNYPLVLRWAGYPSEGNFIGIVGNWRSRSFGKALVKAFEKNEGLPVDSLFLPFDGRVLPTTRMSDHASFWDAGLPAVMVTDTAFFRNPNYHLPTDTIDTLDFGFMAELVRSLELALADLPPIG